MNFTIYSSNTFIPFSLSSLNHGRGCPSRTILLSSLGTAQNHHPHRHHWHPTRPHLPTLQCQHTPHPSPPIKWRHNTAAVASAAPSISHVTPHLLPKHYGQRNNALPTQHTTLQPPIFPTRIGAIKTTKSTVPCHKGPPTPLQHNTTSHRATCMFNPGIWTRHARHLTWWACGGHACCYTFTCWAKYGCNRCVISFLLCNLATLTQTLEGN